MRYAVIGLGAIVQEAVLPAFARADNAELAALVSGSRDKREKLAARYGVTRAVDYADLEAVLEDGDIDAVYIATPNHLHCEHTVRAAGKGVHVLCEKPMAVTESECRQMIEACERTGVRLMIAYRLHFDRANLEASDLVARGELGDVRLFSSVFTQQVEAGDVRLLPLARGGGTVYDLGVYCINAARYLFRCEPIEVTARSVMPGQGRFSECDEMTTALLRFPGDRLAQLTTSFGANRVNEYRIVGTRGSLHMEPAYDYDVPLRYVVRVDEDVRSHRLGTRDQFAPELVYFSRCLQREEPPEPDGLEGLIDVRIVRAIYLSALEQRPVRLQWSERSPRPSVDQAISIYD